MPPGTRARPSCRAGCCSRWFVRSRRMSSRSSTARPRRTWRWCQVPPSSTCGRSRSRTSRSCRSRPATTACPSLPLRSWKRSTAALENQVVFSVGDVVLSSRLVEGRFPNYQQLLPDSYEHELRIDRRELLDVVRRIGLLAQKNAPLRLAFSEGALEVSAQTPDVGEAKESLPVPFSGESLEIGFNPEFFREGLESAESDELILKLISPLRPGLIESGDGGGFIYLVMPIRLNV